jgi:hypothetical protein
LRWRIRACHEVKDESMPWGEGWEHAMRWRMRACHEVKDESMQWGEEREHAMRWWESVPKNCDPLIAFYNIRRATGALDLGSNKISRRL